MVNMQATQGEGLTGAGTKKGRGQGEGVRDERMEIAS